MKSSFPYTTLLSISPLVFFVFEDVLPVIASGQGVIYIFFWSYPRLSCHAWNLSKLLTIITIIKKLEPSPFSFFQLILLMMKHNAIIEMSQSLIHQVSVNSPLRRRATLSSARRNPLFIRSQLILHPQKIS